MHAYRIVDISTAYYWHLHCAWKRRSLNAQREIVSSFIIFGRSFAGAPHIFARIIDDAQTGEHGSAICPNVSSNK
jgi:hypothetical protein